MRGIIIYKKDKVNNKYLTEFMTLAEWMMQTSLFDYVSQINFFKYYLVRKILTLMHNKIRRRT